MTVDSCSSDAQELYSQGTRFRGSLLLILSSVLAIPLLCAEVAVDDACYGRKLTRGRIAGGVDVTTSDGEKRRFQDGDILLVEDTTGVVSSCITTSVC